MPDRNFKIPAVADRTLIEHYAELYACHFVDAVIDDPRKLSTRKDYLLADGQEDAKERGLSGQRADWYAMAYADTLDLLLVPHEPRLGPAKVLGSLFVSTFYLDIQRLNELLKTGDNDAASAFLNNQTPNRAFLEYGTKIYIEDLAVMSGMAKIHIEGNPQVLYVEESDLHKGIKQ